MSLVHARGLLRVFWSSPRAIAILLVIASNMAFGLAATLFMIQMGHEESVLAVPMVGLGSAALWQSLRVPTQTSSPMVPVRPRATMVVEAFILMIPTALVAAPLFWLVAILQLGPLAPSTFQTMALGVALLLLTAPLVLAGTTSPRGKGWEALAPVLPPTLLVITALGLGLLAHPVGVLLTTATMTGIVLACARTEWGKVFRGPLESSRTQQHARMRVGLNSRKRLQADLLLGIGRSAALAVLGTVVGYGLAVAMRTSSPVMSLAGFVSTQTIFVCLLVAMIRWSWLPVSERWGREHDASNMLPCRRLRFERAAFIHLIALLPLYGALTALGAAWLATSLGTEGLDEWQILVSLSAVFPAAGWLIMFTSRFHMRSGRGWADQAVVIAVVMVWMFGSTMLEHRIGSALLNGFRGIVPDAALQALSTHLVFATTFLTLLIVLRLVWLRPERRTP